MIDCINTNNKKYDVILYYIYNNDYILKINKYNIFIY
jgi:hypothetical protein